MKLPIIAITCVVWLTMGCQIQQNINSTVDATTGIGTIPQERASEKNLAIAQAKIIFQQQLALGNDFSHGPCLSERIIDDWAVDIAHVPRTDEDNQPENQCQSYRKGTTHHFVELDLEGNLIRAE
jgi:hypothetical protein